MIEIIKLYKNTMMTNKKNIFQLTTSLKIIAVNVHKVIKMKTFIRSFLIFTFGLSVAVWPLSSTSQDATQMLPALQQFFDNDGNPLSKGTVTTYIAGTSTLKTTWQNSAQSILNTNPIVLDAAGRATIYGVGTYRQLVKDSLGNTIWDAVTNVAGSGGGGGGAATGDGDLVGTIKPWAGLTAPNQYVFAYGQELNRADYPEFYTAIVQTVNVNCTATSNVLTGIADTTQIKIGSAVEASCVSGGTTVSSKTSSSVTVSNPANITLTVSATFFPWGNGNGATTFNVPDYRDVALMGRPNMGGTDRGLITSTYFGTTPGALGALGGSQSKTLITGNLPAYTPSGTVAITDPGHTHDVKYTGSLYQGGGNVGVVSISSGGASTGTDAAVSKTTGITAAFTGSAQGGTSTAFSIIQPSVTVNYIVKVTPDENSAVASGVTSLGGMTGSIACGASIICTGNIISLFTPIQVPEGGTGNVTLTADTFYKGNGTSAMSTSLLTDNGSRLLYTGTSGYALQNSALSPTTVLAAPADRLTLGWDFDGPLNLRSGTTGSLNTSIDFYTAGVLRGSLASTGLTLGTSGSLAGSLFLASSAGAGQRVSLSASTGTPDIVFGNTSGTPAVVATSPLSIDSATGLISLSSSYSPVIWQSQEVILKRTNASPDNATWMGYDAFGAELICNSGSTCLAAAIMKAFPYSLGNPLPGYDLRIVGGTDAAPNGATYGGGAIVLLGGATTTTAFPPSQGKKVEIGAVTFDWGAGIGSSPCVTYNSAMMTFHRWEGGQIVCRSTGPGVEFLPSDPFPLDVFAGKGIIDSSFMMPSIGAIGGVKFTMGAGSGNIGHSIFRFPELLLGDGTGCGFTAAIGLNGAYGANNIQILHMHGTEAFTAYCVTGTNTAFNPGNWIEIVVSQDGVGALNCKLIDTTNSNDRISIKDIHGCTGTPAILFNAGACGNTVYLESPATNPTVTDNGGCTNPNRVYLNGYLYAGPIVTAELGNSQVTFAKIQNIAPTSLVGRTSGTGAPENITTSQALDFIASVQGSLLYRGASGWTNLSPGTAGLPLISQGSGADPMYAALGLSGGGTNCTSPSISCFNNITGYTAAGTTGTTTTNLVFSTSPTLVTPSLGDATATTLNKVTFTPPATGATLTIADGKTLIASNSLTFTGTDSTSFAFPSTSGTVATLNTANSFSLPQDISNSTAGIARLLTIRNTSNNSGAYSIIGIGNDISSSAAEFGVLSSTNSTYTGPSSFILLSQSAPLALWTASASRISFGINTSEIAQFGSTGGLVLGVPTGTDKGTGTINVATNIYANGTVGLTTTVVVPCGTLTFTMGILTSKGAC